jgi:hypothetical protein
LGLSSHHEQEKFKGERMNVNAKQAFEATQKTLNSNAAILVKKLESRILKRTEEGYSYHDETTICQLEAVGQKAFELLEAAGYKVVIEGEDWDFDLKIDWSEPEETKIKKPAK